MTQYILAIAALSAVVGAAPPASPRLYQHQEQLQQINPFDYYLHKAEVPYYNDIQQKQGNLGSSADAAPARLETLEPDSEVELIPGAQPPQQPPQQNPVAPNIPGLLPGQRVFIVHMPVPGYRPGTIGGYQPVYIVAAAPQGNPGVTPNGYQSTVFLDQSGQVVSPYVGYPNAVGVAPSQQPGLLLGPSLRANRPFDVYQNPITYHPVTIQEANGHPGAIRLGQIVALQVQPVNPGEPKPAVMDTPSNSQHQKQVSNSNQKEYSAEIQHNARPAPPHSQTRNPPQTQIM